MGDIHRIPRSIERKQSDIEFQRLLSIDPHKLGHRLSPFYTRPVYAYTKAAVGGHKSWLSEHTMS